METLNPYTLYTLKPSWNPKPYTLYTLGGKIPYIP